MLFTKKSWLRYSLSIAVFMSATLSVSCAKNKAASANSSVIFIANSKDITFERALQNLQIIANAKFGEEFSGQAVTVANIIPNSDIAVIKGRQVFERSTSDFPNLNFYFDVSASSWNGPNIWVNRYVAPLIRSAAIGQALFDVKIINDKGIIKNEITVQQPSLFFYKLELIKTIEITLENGKVKIYDNDKHEKLPDFPERKFSESSYRLSSLDQNSINNPQFFLDLQKAQKVSLSVHKNIPWVNYKGEKSKYFVKVEDFYTSYLRTQLVDSEFRRKNGGSKELDDILLTETDYIRFDDSTKISASYIYDLYGVNEKLLWNKDLVITKNTLNEDAFTIYALDSVKNKRIDLAFKFLFIDNMTFLPAPSQYIKDNNLKFNMIEGKRKSIDTKTIKRKASGLAAETGIYWYAKNLDTILFASPFIPHKIMTNASEGTITFKANPHYVDQAWVNSKTRILDHTRQFQKPGDTSALQTRFYNGFATGLITRLSLSQIPESNRQAIISGTDSLIKPSTKFLDYTISKNFVASQNDWMWLVHPKAKTFASEIKNGKSVTKISEPNYKWNDNYAKIVYGSTIAKLKEGNERVAKHFFQGDSVTFRTLLTSAINSVTQANNFSSKLSKTWFSHWPTDVDLGGSDHQSATFKTPRDGYDLINSTFVVKDNKKILETTYDQYLQGSFSPLEEKAFRNPQFQKLQAIMTELLDKKEYREITKDNPIEADISYWLTSWDFIRSHNLDSTVAAINALDKKGRIRFRAVKTTDIKNLYDYFVGSEGTMETHGWTADYPGAASFLHSTTTGKGLTLLSAFGLFGDDPVDSQAFPELQRVARTLKQNIGPGKGLELRFKVPFKDWKHLTNSDAQDLHKWLDLEIDGKMTNYASELARFFLNYQNKITNQQWINLIREVTMLWCSMFQRYNIVADLKTGNPILVQPGFITPKTSANTSYFNDARFIIRDN